MKTYLMMLLILALTPMLHATVLTFDFTVTQPYMDIPQDYGDWVTDFDPAGDVQYGSAGGLTPNIEVWYGRDSRHDGGANGLTNVMFSGDAEGGGIQIKLTADTGFAAVLHSLNLAAWGEDRDVTVIVKDAADAVIFNQVFTALSTGGATFVDFGNLPSSEILWLGIDVGVHGDNIAIDNVQFSQIPEPATCLLLIIGATAILKKN